MVCGGQGHEQECCAGGMLGVEGGVTGYDVMCVGVG